MISDAQKHILQPVSGINTMFLAASEEGVHRRRPLRTFIRIALAQGQALFNRAVIISADTLDPDKYWMGTAPVLSTRGGSFGRQKICPGCGER